MPRIDAFQLRKAIPHEEFDYNLLCGALSQYSGVRQKIHALLQAGVITRVKKGLYVFGPGYNQAPVCKEVLANLIYGPSYISLEYALAFHGLIPERVEVITCVCFKRNKKFSTPIGEFNYRYQAQELYPLGIHLMQTSLGNFFLATPEKALCDIAYDLKMTSTEEALDYLLGSLRCDEEELRKLNASLLMRLVKIYKRRSVQHLVEALIIFQQKDN
jgi:predicted transcriptional regulator of viral defense system